MAKSLISGQITITSYNICNIKQKARSRDRTRAKRDEGMRMTDSTPTGPAAPAAGPGGGESHNLVKLKTMSKHPLKNEVSGGIFHSADNGRNEREFAASDGLERLPGRQLTDGIAAPDGLGFVRPVAPCVADRRVLDNASDLPPGVVAVADLVPAALEALGLPSFPADSLPVTESRLIHDRPALVDGENGQRSETSSSEPATRADQPIVSKSRIEAAPPLQMDVDLVARKVSKFAKMLDAMPLSLRNEDARQALRLDLLEYRDRLGFLLESSCPSQVTPASVSLAESSFPAPLITSYNSDSPMKIAICNIKQKGRSRAGKRVNGDSDMSVTDSATTAPAAPAAAAVVDESHNLVLLKTMRYLPMRNDLSVEIFHVGGNGNNGREFAASDGLETSTGRQLTDGMAAPDGLGSVCPVAPCVADLGINNNALPLPPGVVAVADLVPPALAELGLGLSISAVAGDSLHDTAARLIHDSPAPVDVENGQRSVHGSSETATGADQGIVSKSRIKAAPPLQIRVDRVARRVSQFAKMLDAMPLSLRNEDARQALRVELLEYRDRLGFMLEADCLSHVTNTSDSRDFPSFRAPLITSHNSDSPMKIAICNIKQLCRLRLLPGASGFLLLVWQSGPPGCQSAHRAPVYGQPRASEITRPLRDNHDSQTGLTPPNNFAVLDDLRD